MDILEQKKSGMKNDVRNMATRMNPDFTSVIYLTDVKVPQCRMVYENRR